MLGGRCSMLDTLMSFAVLRCSPCRCSWFSDRIRIRIRTSRIGSTTGSPPSTLLVYCMSNLKDPRVGALSAPFPFLLPFSLFTSNYRIIDPEPSNRRIIDPSDTAHIASHPAAGPGVVLDYRPRLLATTTSYRLPTHWHWHWHWHWHSS